jgi:hypothetical protein
MTSRDFVYWLQGMFELTDTKQLDERQTALVRAHLALVFVHEIDPSAGPTEHQVELNKIHGDAGGVKPPTIGGVGPGGVIYRC